MESHHAVGSFGKYSYHAGFTIMSWPSDGQKYLHVGNYCSIANGLTVILGGNHMINWVTTYPFGDRFKHIFSARSGNPSYSNGDIRIGNDVWIGTNVTLMSGITIGDGAVIAANTHVVKDVPPYAIIGGNPARIIKYRFTPELINALLKIQWWNWPEEKINANIPLMCNDDIDEFVSKHTG